MLVAVVLSAASPEKHLSVYSTAANYSLPVVQRQGRDYVGLLELLEPLGAVSAKLEGPRWRLRYNHVLGEFTDDKNRCLLYTSVNSSAITARQPDVPNLICVNMKKYLSNCKC